MPVSLLPANNRSGWLLHVQTGTTLIRSLFCLICFALQVNAAEVFGQNADQNPTLLPPTPAPDSILGSVDYYAWRENDFTKRVSEAGYNINTPPYYCNYGHKYAHRFTWHIRPRLTEEGQQWLDKTLLLLQVGTEVCLLQEPLIELNPEELNRQLFQLHPQVYEAAGFFELAFRDQFAIVIRLDPSDLTSPEGRQQVVALAKGYLRAKINALIHPKKRRTD